MCEWILSDWQGFYKSV